MELIETSDVQAGFFAKIISERFGTARFQSEPPF